MAFEEKIAIYSIIICCTCSLAYSYYNYNIVNIILWESSKILGSKCGGKKLKLIIRKKV